MPQITFEQALDTLYMDTGDEKYKRFTMNGNLGPWEEVRLTEIASTMVALSQFPLLEVPFYHAPVDGVRKTWRDKETKIFHNPQTHLGFPLSGSATRVEYDTDKESLVADNTDIIWPGYRETIGSGHRVRSQSELEEKARIFQLPREDYRPYLQTREFPNYVETSGFGLGWERMLQGLLEMPFIWSAVQFPRGHTTLEP